MPAAVDEVITSTPKKSSKKGSKKSSAKTDKKGESTGTTQTTDTSTQKKEKFSGKSKKSHKTDKSDKKQEEGTATVQSSAPATTATSTSTESDKKKSSKKEKKSSKKEKKSGKSSKRDEVAPVTSEIETEVKKNDATSKKAKDSGKKTKKDTTKEIRGKKIAESNTVSNSSIVVNDGKPSLVDQLSRATVAKEVGPAVLKAVNTSEMLGSTDGDTDADGDDASDDEMPQAILKEEADVTASDTEKDWEMIEAASGDEGTVQKSEADTKEKKVDTQEKEVKNEESKKSESSSAAGDIVSAIAGAIGGLFSVTAVAPQAVVAKTWVPVEKGEDVVEKENKKKIKDEKRRKYQEAHGDDDVSKEEKEALYVVKPKNYAEVESDHDSDDEDEVAYKSHVNDGISDLSDLSDDSDAESESEDEEIVEVKEEKKNTKLLTKTQQRNSDRERSMRTVFVGNVPIKCNHGAFKAQFKEFGAIESVRFRSVAVAKPKMSKMIAFVTHQTHAERTSMNAYIVYKTKEGCEACLENAKGAMFGGYHLRVDRAGGNENRVQDTKSTVFVGGLPPNVEDEMLYQAFAQCGSVESVRCVRDKVTGIGKGIAYVKFEKEESVSLALRLTASEIGGKTIRVQKAMSRDSQTKAKDSKTNDFQGAQAQDRKRKGGDDKAGKKKKVRWDKKKLEERDAKEGTISRALSRPDRTVFEKPAKPERGVKRERETKEEKAHKKAKTTKEEKKAKKPKWTDEKRKEKGVKTKGEKHREKKMGKEGAERRVRKSGKASATKA